MDNKRDKSGARLDQIRAGKVDSVLALIHASLLRTILANYLVYLDLCNRPPERAPMHGLALAFALSSNLGKVLDAVLLDEPCRWARLARILRARGHDPNWRRRPSHLDELRGTTAPPGRPRSANLDQCPPNAQPYRQTA